MPTPCNECPFRKDIQPGYLGGSPAETYVGQLQGPFNIPCHMSIDYSDPQWREKSFDVAQCRGAASLRASMKIDGIMPIGIDRIEPSELAFDSIEAFYAHHKGIAIEEAQKILSDEFMMLCLTSELSKAGVIIKPCHANG